MEEIWKDIDFIVEPDGTCAYQVSNLGNVRRAKEVVSVIDAKRLGVAGFTGRYTRRLKPTLLKINNTYDKCGRIRYSFVSIKDHTYAVHKLVARTFLPDTYKEGLVVNHKDGNRHNNCVDNLEWCTQGENELHSYRVLGKRVWNKGTKGLMPKKWAESRRAKYIERNKAIYSDYLSGIPAKELANIYGICLRSIHQIIKDSKDDSQTAK